MCSHRYRDLSGFLRERFGFKVRKIPLDAGLGCPNRDSTLGGQGCVYCDVSGSGTGAWSRGLGITQQIQSYLQAPRRGKVKGYLAYFQSFTNTYAPLEVLRALYREAMAFPEVVGLCIGTRPDCLDDDVLDLLSEINARVMLWLELGLQSAHDETLRKIGRGHSFQTFKEAVERASQRDILVCTHLILGLPGEGMEHVRATAKRISPLPIHGLKLHGLYVVKGTQMESLYKEGLYEPWSLEQYADGVCDVLELIPREWVIHRLCSDPDPRNLLAPSWMLDKQSTLQRIHARMLERNTWQGRLCINDPGQVSLTPC
ncbi:MAG: TIGR01212 family radical SAM protein [bacterium]